MAKDLLFAVSKLRRWKENTSYESLLLSLLFFFWRFPLCLEDWNDFEKRWKMTLLTGAKDS